MADYWAKIYIEILDDPKMAVMPDRIWRRTIELILIAKKLNQGGKLPETKQIAWVLRLPVEEVEKDLHQIEPTGIIQQTPTGWFIPKFARRQDAATPSERKHKQRERDQKEQYYSPENVTDLSRNVTQRTETESETETETEKSTRPDRFFKVQHAIEEITGLLPDTGAPKAINDIIAMGARREDVQAGYVWLRNQGKTMRYYSQLVGPARTAMSIRVGKNNIPSDPPRLTEEELRRRALANL